MGPENIAVMIPIVALMIPIVYILVRHQQKMAEIVHSRPQANQEIDALRSEVNELKSLIHQQMISVDSMLQTQKSMAPSAPSAVSSQIEERLADR